MAASTAQNNIVRGENQAKSIFESLKPVLAASAACTWNQGDLLCFDNTNKIVVPVTGSGSGAQILGVARNTVSSGLPVSPYQGTAVDASEAISDMAGPAFGVVAFFTLKTGDAFNPGDPVYLTTTNPQTVTSGAAGSAVGVYVGAVVASAAAGQQGNVLVGAYQPGGTTLLF